MRSWTVSTHASGRPRDVELHLYSSARSMRAAANRWAVEVGTGETFHNADGVCHGFDRIRVDEDGYEHEDELVCIIRLHEKRLRPDVVAHEVAHAAQHIYRLDLIDEDGAVSDHMHAGNEPFAWLMGELFGAVWGAVTSERAS